MKVKLERKAGLLSRCVDARVSTVVWIHPEVNEEVGRGDDGQRWK